jgi:hypothetical protein
MIQKTIKNTIMKKLKLIPKRKSGYILDYDPKNPYHVHNNGEKIVITPEQYEKHKDEPYFANIRKQVEEHQAAYPGPEYTETPNPEYRKVYANVKAASNQHFKEHNFNGQTHREYSIVPKAYFRNSVDGVVTDEQGNLYRPMTQADIGRGVTPMFTTTERDYHNGRNFDMSWVRVKTPAKTIKTLKQPLPVNKTYNVDEDLNNSVNEYIKNNTEYYNEFKHGVKMTDPAYLKAIEFFPNKGRKDDDLLIFDEGTLTVKDLSKMYPMIDSKSSPATFGYFENVWIPKSPTKQQALNNIQLKIN